ncbi:hypothetical protein GLAREA_06560 [Glarea lozoyensis ATCC 20868]|uniref:Uncharacterized protein n=1 Tax=Glarea lozoyensis (strain ATCC 20868 / MF5171) TaxID=1116229 RepID=S3D514_GLAL2|nr:uncharacterized protein GLAREA_06560 [Glarea lozoyensis ATCC 20868]EPE33547.1 hypothetical protein GLAREA_06560 [Glarea lozoyensis ATCC 20868]
MAAMRFTTLDILNTLTRSGAHSEDPTTVAKTTFEHGAMTSPGSLSPPDLDCAMLRPGRSSKTSRLRRGAGLEEE